MITVHPEDNMSLAELIKTRYRKHIKVNRLKTPEDAASVLIKDTKEFDVNDEAYFDGTKDEQEELKTQLGEHVETDLSESWKDMPAIKQRLWTKLHGASSSLKSNVAKQMNNLAQKLAQSSSTAGGLFDSIKVKGTSGQLFEMDSTSMVIIIILAVLLTLCCTCYLTTLCCVSSAAKEARQKQQETEEQLRQDKLSEKQQ